MNSKQKLFVKEQTIEITDDFESVLWNNEFPDGIDKAFFQGEKYKGYIQPTWNTDGTPLSYINLINKHYMITCIPLTHFKVLI